MPCLNPDTLAPFPYSIYYQRKEKRLCHILRKSMLGLFECPYPEIHKTTQLTIRAGIKGKDPIFTNLQRWNQPSIF